MAVGGISTQTIRLCNGDGNDEAVLPILPATEGPNTLDIRKLYQLSGLFTFDPGFMSTASCESKITYIDGLKGHLWYRGYPIEQLAKHSNFVETAYLLYYGKLPTEKELERFTATLARESHVDNAALTKLESSFPRDAHPMAMLMSSLSLLAAQDHDEKTSYERAACRELSALRLIARVPVITARILRYGRGQDTPEPDPALSYTKNFLSMAFGKNSWITQHEVFEKALDLIFLLHADHEQNASTSAVRLSGSTGTSPYAAIVAGVASLWGAAHGGANEAVIRMLEAIVTEGKPIGYYIDRAKDRNDPFKLMGFGHRIYKNYDPRAKIIRTCCRQLLETLPKDNSNRPLLTAARELEKIALEDKYFTNRKLYPNVDFYSGIILNALELPSVMFTTIFAMARTVGWVSHWNEMKSEKSVRIGRPRQLYTGEKTRDYKTFAQR